MFAPLTGCRVIDVTQVLAGPYCTYQLGLLGAEVIKIELPGIGDWTRVGGGDAELSQAGMGTSFLTQNANKKSVTLNLKTSKGAEILKQLIASANVFIENFKPGTAASLGIGYDDVRPQPAFSLLFDLCLWSRRSHWSLSGLRSYYSGDVGHYVPNWYP